MNHGLKFVVPVEGDYVHGTSRRLGGEALQPDGQWDAFLPIDERQNLAMEPEACASFGTLNAVETLHKREYNEEINYSDRFLAKVSGTTTTGNDPQTVAETLRKKGVVKQDEWQYTPDINTWDKFYAEIPQNILTDGLQFVSDEGFGHEWVGTDPQRMMSALQFSPLCVDVYAWLAPGLDGIYHRNGLPSGHWCMVYGYIPNQYWKCFDSYDNTHKKLAWDFGFTMVKRYTLHKVVIQEHLFLKNLGFQMTDPEVAFLQTALVSLGYPIPHAVTTLFATETRDALAKFQKDHGIIDDGTHLGPKTRLALNKALNPLGGVLLSIRTYLGI